MPKDVDGIQGGKGGLINFSRLLGRGKEGGFIDFLS